MKSAALSYISRWATSVALIVIIMVRVDFSALKQTLLGADIWVYPAGILIAILSQIIATLKWRTFLPVSSFAKLLQLNLISQFYLFLIPSTLTGDVTRALKIDDVQQDLTDAHASIFLDRLIGLLSLLVMMIMVSVLTSEPRIASIFFSISCVLVSIGISVWIISRVLRNKRASDSNQRFMARVKQTPYIGRIIDVVPVGVSKLSPSNSLQGISYGVAFQLAMSLYLYVCFAALSIDVPFVDCVILNLASQVASFVPAGIGGIGIRDVSIVGVAQILGYTGTAMWAGVLVGYPVILSIVLLGYVLDIRWKRLARGSNT
jgi:uncharacterized protein (TIRG00374 family)